MIFFVYGKYDWLSVALKFHICRPIPRNESLILEMSTNSCAGSETEVNFLEHVQAVITLNATRRGDVTLFLISPLGTRYVVLTSVYFSKLLASFFTLYLIEVFMYESFKWRAWRFS